MQKKKRVSLRTPSLCVTEILSNAWSQPGTLNHFKWFLAYTTHSAMFIGNNPHVSELMIHPNQRAWLNIPTSQALGCLFPAKTVIQMVMVDMSQGR